MSLSNKQNKPTQTPDDETSAIIMDTCIGTFVFSKEINNLRIFHNELCRNCWTEFEEDLAYNLYKENISVQELCKIMSNLVWDECADGQMYNLPYEYHVIFDAVDLQNEGAILRNLLILSGDVETNPGPVFSHPVEYRNNDPRYLQLEKVIEKQKKQIRDLVKQLRREIKHKRIYTQGIFKDVTGLGKIVDEQGDKLNDNLTKICDFLENALPTYVNTFNVNTKEITDAGSNIKEDVIKIIIVSLVIKLLMTMEHNKLALVIILGFIIRFYNLDSSIISLVTQLKDKIVGETKEVHTQGFMDSVEACIYHPYFDICGKILFSVIAFVSIKQIPGKKDWDNYMTRLDKIPKAKKGAKEIIDYCSEYFNAANDCIKMMVLGKSKEELQRANGLYTEIHEWAQEVRHYLDLEQRNKIDLDITVANKVEDLYKRGLKYQSDPLLDREISRLVAVTLLPARELYQYVSSSPVKGGGPRMRPICLWLVGESGVGKTEMVYPLCIDILRAMGLTGKQDFHHQVYGRQVETEFWDGYKGQKIVIYDDAFQKKDDKTSPNPEIFEVIRSCNTFPQHLHMAALHDKNTYSQAEILLYTTNNYNVSLESITFPEAFYNRMGDHAYKVRPKLEYSKEVKKPNSTEIYRKLDKTKLDRSKAIDLGAYEFQRIIKNQNNDVEWIETGEAMDYVAFSSLICNEWKREKEQSINKLKFLENYATRIDAQIGEEKQVTKDNIRKELQEKTDIFYDSLGPDYFANDIASRIAKGETLMEIEASYAEEREMHIAYHYWKKKEVKVSKWTKYINRIDAVMQDVNKYLYDLKIKVKELLSNHPYLVMLGFVSMIIAAFGLYKTFESYFFSSSKQEKSKAIRFVGKPQFEVGTSGDAKTNKQQIKRIEAKVPPKEKDAEMRNLARGIFKDIPEEKKEEFKKSMLEIFKVDIFAEAGTSGDAKTNKQQIKRIEMDQEEIVPETVNEQSENENDDGSELKGELEEVLEKHVDIQGCSDLAAHSLVVDVIRKNTYRLSYFRNEKRIAFGNCTFLKGWCFVIPYHFLHVLNARNLPLDTLINFSQPGQNDIIQIELAHFIKQKEPKLVLTDNCARFAKKNGDLSDCVIVSLHAKMCHPHRDLVKHFVRVSDQGKLVGKFSGVLATYHESDGELSRAYQWLQQIRPFDKQIKIHYPDDGFDYGEKCFIQRDCYEYNAPTQVGDCGSLIGLYNHRIERKLIGMHIAGTDEQYGFACPLTQEAIERTLSELEEKQIKNVSAQFYYEVDNSLNPDLDPKVPEGLFVPLAKSSKAVGQAVRSAIIPSLLHGKISTPTMKPALLRPKIIDGEIVDPLMKGLKKCGISTAVLPELDVLSASQDVCQVVLTKYNSMVNIEKYQRILTYEEAIAGTRDDDYMCAVNRTTSPGYPYCLTKRNGPGKTDWMGNNENFDFTSPKALQLKKDVETLLEDCANGKITGVVFIDTLKDERRDIAKVDVGKTRVFSAGPQHFVVAFRQYFLPFAAYLMHNRIDNEVCVGSNPYSLDWERIARRLQAKGEQVIAGDFGNFDGSLVAQILWSIFWEIFVPWLERFNDFSSPEGKRVLKTSLGLWTHLVHSVHIFDDNVYMWTHSQPSGNPFTVIINCLYNSIIMRISWISIMRQRKPEWMSMKCFRKYVSMVSFGDDNVLNISDEALDLFNQETISEIMKDLKHEYTDEAKSGTIVKSRKLNEIFFLKRGFVHSEELQRTIAPLKIEVIYEMLNWSRNTIDPNIILMANIEVAMREIVYHGRHEYKRLKNKIFEFVDILPEYPQILTYEQYLHDVKYLADAVYDF